MAKLSFTLETVTPLFLGGADPFGEPELRPPAFRGAMRYWIRALAGGLFDSPDNIEKVKKIETEVYGSATDKESTASSISIRIANRNLKPIKVYARIRDKRGRFPRPTPGRDYLYWSMSDFRGKSSRKFIPEGSSFDLVLSVRPGVKNSNQLLERAAASLWLLINLGGVGARSRRAAGSLSVITPESIYGLNFKLDRRDYKGMAQQIAGNISKIRSLLIKNTRHPDLEALSEFDIIHPSVCKIWVLGAWGNAEAAVMNVGNRMREFRERSEPDHNNVARWLIGERIPTVERAAFGLPLPFRYTNGPSGIIQGKLGKNGIDRRASPLWLKISKVDSNLYIAVATLFQAKLLPDGEKLYARKARDQSIWANTPSNYTLIENWVDEKFPNAREVEL